MATAKFTSHTTYTADSMARKYGITVDQLQALNPGHNVRAGIVSGATINVPTTTRPLQGSTAAPVVTTGTPGTFTPENRNIADSLSGLFQQYGLGSLSTQIVTMAQQGLGPDSISLALQQTPEYKQRFAGNDARIKAGMNALSPAEYISTEQAYRQIMSNAGLPMGFYDQQSDFTDLISRDISPTELQDRVSAASEAINQAPSSVVDYAKNWYQIGDLVAFALDPTKAKTTVDTRIKAAEAAALGQRNGVGVSQGTAEQIGAQGLSYAQMQQGFGDVGQEAPTASKLSQIYGVPLTTDDLVKEVFQNDATATNKVKGLASQERATFGGSSSTTKGSFSSDGGQF